MNNVLKNSDVTTTTPSPTAKALPIPRRPKYIEKTKIEEFDRLEREAFLNWRRALAQEEEHNIHFAITPFEKNIEIWRQLWMVVDKADLLVQIVDGRNPMYFRCDDLEKYVKECNSIKETVLLINKADLMSIPVRKHWADYFKEKGINYVFFSAKKEAEVIAERDKTNMLGIIDDEEKQKEKDDKEVEGLSDDEDNEPSNVNNLKNQFELLNMINNDNDDAELIEDKFEKNLDKISKTNDQVTEEVKVQEQNTENNAEQNIEEDKEENEDDKLNQNIENEDTEEELTDDLKILNREQLIKYLKNKVSSIETKVNYNIGFVGFPNVGKSSVINVIMNEKKVSPKLYFSSYFRLL